MNLGSNLPLLRVALLLKLLFMDLCHHGIVHSIASDQRTYFTAKELQKELTVLTRSIAFPFPHYTEATGLIKWWLVF